MPTRRAHRGAIVIQPDKPNTEKDPLDLPSGELRNLVRGLIWRDEHFGGIPRSQWCGEKGILRKSRRLRASRGYFSLSMADVYVDGCVRSHPITILMFWAGAISAHMGKRGSDL